jgi:hypothetical protein
MRPLAGLEGVLAGRARKVVEALERSDVEAIYAELSDRAQAWDWDPEEWIVDSWRPRLEALAGTDRTLSGAREVNQVMDVWSSKAATVERS